VAAPAAPAPARAPAPPPIPVPKVQIVTPPDAGEEKAPENARLLSDRSNTVKEEMVRHGEPPAGESETKPPGPPPPVSKAKPEPPAPPAPAPKADIEKARPATRVAALPKLDQLLPSAGDLLREGLSRSAAPTAAPVQQARAAPASRDLLGGGHATFGNRPGISDYLPTIREGDITLLNTKAELFAPFVRRVAARVFQHLDMRLRQAASGGATGAGREYAVVEAIMSKSGQLVSAHVVERQSNSTLGADRELLSVTQPDIFFDANPPPGAEANDGNIHFVLLVDLMVQSAVDPRSGRPSTGYYGIAGVGLDSPPRHN